MRFILTLVFMGLTVFAQTPEDCQDTKPEWVYSKLGNPMGNTGYVVGDFNNNGLNEIIAGARNNLHFWTVLEWDGQDYMPLHIGPTGQVGIKISLLNTGDGPPVLVVAYDNGKITLFDPATYACIDEYWLDQTKVSDLIVADIDGNGIDELVTCDLADVTIYSGIPPFPHIKTYPGMGGGTLLVANLDQDEALELATAPYGVVNGEQHSYLIDLSTDQIEWDYIGIYGFGNHLRAGDIDGDGIKELVGVGGSYLAAFDADIQQKKWEYNDNGARKVMELADLNGDTIAEVIYYDVVAPEVLSLDGSTGLTLWTMPCGYSLSGLLFADIDDDPGLEMVWGADDQGLERHKMIVSNPATQTVKWRSELINGPHEQFTVGDLDGDHRPEFLVCTESGHLTIFDGATKNRIYHDYLLDSFVRAHIAVGDVDNDGIPDIVWGTASYIRVYDSQSMQLKWQSPSLRLLRMAQMQLVNTDDDPQLEILTGGHAYPCHLRTFDVVKGIEEWTSPALGSSAAIVMNFLTGDINADGRLEVVVDYTTGIDIYTAAFELATGAHIFTTPARRYYSVEAMGNLDDDAALELVYNDYSIVDAVTLVTEGQRTLFEPGEPYTLQFIDLDGDGILEWLAKGRTEIAIFDSEKKIWSLPTCEGMRDTILGQLDDDPALEVLVMSSDQLRQYEVCGPGIMQLFLPHWPEQSVSNLLSKVCP